MNGNTIMNNSGTPIFARSLAAAIVAGISLADGRGVKCEIGYGNRNNFGDAFTWLADTL